MEQEYTIKLKKVIKNFDMKAAYLPENGDEIKICSPDVQRPGLALSGFFDFFFFFVLSLETGLFALIFFARETPKSIGTSLWDDIQLLSRNIQERRRRKQEERQQQEEREKEVADALARALVEGAGRRQLV